MRTTTFMTRILPRRENSILPNTFQKEESSLAHRNGHWWPTLFFFLGSIFYLIKAVWNLTDPNRGMSAIFEAQTTTRTTSLSEPDLLYDLPKILGPLMYVFNGLADTSIALISSNADHFRGEIACGLIFTFSAIIDMGNAFFSGGKDLTLTYSFHSLARHSYVVYSIMAIFFKKYPDYKEPARRVNKLGDILFFLGSLIDLVTSYFTRPGDSPDWKEVDIWALISATFWLIDALFFVVADIIESNRCCHCAGNNGMRRSEVPSTEDESTGGSIDSGGNTTSASP